ncbi:MAG TPA: XdhC family protein [Mycobacteriales bacterium]
MRQQLAVRAAELVRARVPFAQATVVRAQHPTSAHAGDTAIVHADGRIDGFVGGACTEESVRRYGEEVIRTGEPLLLRVVPGPPSTSTEDGAVTVTNPCVSGGAVEIFLEPRRPAPRIVVVGQTPVAEALAELAAPLGFAVTSSSGREPPDCAPDDAAVIVASHGRGEQAALDAALHAGVPYVALVGSRIRAASVLSTLDVEPAVRARVRSPAGLDIGARTAPEIALSILAELVAERARPRPPVESRPAGRPGPSATAVDPVCGMTVSTGGTPLTAERDGVTAYFCGEGCRSAWLADPGRYGVVS